MGLNMSTKRKVVNITHNGFPAESHPPQGTITLYFDNDTIEKVFGSTMSDYNVLLIKHGLD